MTMYKLARQRESTENFLLCITELVPSILRVSSSYETRQSCLFMSHMDQYHHWLRLEQLVDLIGLIDCRPLCGSAAVQLFLLKHKTVLRGISTFMRMSDILRT